MATGLGTVVAQVESNRLAEFQKLAPRGFAGIIQAPRCKQSLHISLAQSEPGVKPNGVVNNIR